MSGEVVGLKSGVVDQVLAEGASTKMRAVADHARSIAHSGKKVVIWTIFTETIGELERMLADLNPVMRPSRWRRSHLPRLASDSRQQIWSLGY